METDPEREADNHLCCCICRPDIRARMDEKQTITYVVAFVELVSVLLDCSVPEHYVHQSRAVSQAAHA